jgi:hypothetical protein
MELLKPTVVDEIKTDTGGEYRLLNIDFGDKRGRPYLQMRCPSTKNDHIIGVKPETKTAKEALAFLNNIQTNETVKTVWEA